MVGNTRTKRTELRNRLWQYTKLSSLARFFWLCQLIFQFLQIFLSPRSLYERAEQSGGELPGWLLLREHTVSSCVDVPGPLFRTLPVCTSVFSNLLPGRIILGATCRKKQLKKEIHSEMEVVMFNSALCFCSWTAGALSGLSFIWSPGKAEVTTVKIPFISTVDSGARGRVEPCYCMQPCVQLSSQCYSETF